MKKTLITTISAIAITLSSAADIFAAGSPYSPYSPYGGHTPVPTSVGGLFDAIILVGIIAYIVGMLLTVNATKIKALIK